MDASEPAVAAAGAESGRTDDAEAARPRPGPSALVVLSGFDSAKVKALIDDFTLANKGRTAESNRREFLARSAPPAPSPAPSPAPIKRRRVVDDSDSSDGGAESGGEAGSAGGSKSKRQRSSTAETDGGEPSTCARTEIVPINRSTQMRRQVVYNPDDALARSILACEHRDRPRWVFAAFPAAFHERVGNLWSLLNVDMRSLTLASITLCEALELLHRRLLEMEHGYHGWLVRNKPRLRPEHLGPGQVASLVYPPADACADLFTIAFQSNGLPTGLSRAVYAAVKPVPGPAFHGAIVRAHCTRALKMLEDRLARIEHLAPLWFALNCKYPGRPRALPPAPVVAANKMGPRWAISTEGAPRIG
ncbi:hypothetical protein H9P43_010068 [Blastocladiella emersonii ATCC 22665]|nr:hypothetical protein H9P43_010068 [Blastocladiella emersonii ATCC 22665]